MRSNTIFATLVKKYILFSFSLGLVVYLTSVLLNWQTQFRLIDPSVEKVTASRIARSDYTHIDSSFVESLGGFIAILDEKLQVVKAFGNRAGQPDRYTEGQLLGLYSRDFNQADYLSLAPFQTEDGRTYRCFVQIPRSSISQDLIFLQTPKAFVQSSYILFGWIILALLGLVILNVYIYSRWTARKITNPLEALARGMQQMASGRFRTRLMFKADYELAQIQDTFNSMAGQLEQSESARQRLEESRQRMLVGISHDLKTPITTIQGYSQALQMGIADTETKRQKYLDYIVNKSQVLTHLIDEIFELSKLDSPDYHPEMEVSDLCEFVRHAAAQYYDLFEEAGHRLTINIPSQDIQVPIHSGLLYRALSNLLSNALKHCPAGTRVMLTLAGTANSIRIALSDDGPAIPDALKPIIFDPFTRADASRTRNGGSGLGLAIAQHVMDKHGGSIQLDEKEGVKTFSLILPKPTSI